MAAKKPVRRNYPPTSVRMRDVELQAIQQAAVAFSPPSRRVDAAQVIWAAAYTEAIKLGFTMVTLGTRRAERRLPRWDYEPERPETESLTARKNITVPPLIAWSVREAAAAVNVPYGSFLLGSALKLIRDRQRIQPDNKLLQAIELPTKFRAL